MVGLESQERASRRYGCPFIFTLEMSRGWFLLKGTFIAFLYMYIYSMIISTRAWPCAKVITFTKIALILERKSRFRPFQHE